MTYKDTIDNLLRERAHEVGTLSWRQQMGRKRATMLWGLLFKWVGLSFTVRSVLALVLFVWNDANPPLYAWLLPVGVDGLESVEQEEDYLEFGIQLFGYMTLIFAPLLFIGWSMVDIANKSLAEQEIERQGDKALRARFTELDMADRVGLVGHLSSIEVEQLRSVGIVTVEEARQLREDQRDRQERKEAKRVRDWQSGENEKDRQLTIDQLITKFEGQIREIETRMELEKPGAKRQSEEARIALAGRVTELKEINKWRTVDPVMHKQLFDDYKRRYGLS